MNEETRTTKVLEHAQKLFKQHYAQCFWHLKPDLIVTESNLPIIIKGLRVNGNRATYIAAAELERKGATT